MFKRCAFRRHFWILSVQRLDGYTGHAWKPLVQSFKSSVFCFDNFICHKQPEFLNILKEIGVHREPVLIGYTCMPQPCNVRTMKSLKLDIRQQYSQWASERLFDISATHYVPAPDRKRIPKRCRIHSKTFHLNV